LRVSWKVDLISDITTADLYSRIAADHTTKTLVVARNFQSQQRLQTYISTNNGAAMAAYVSHPIVL